LKTAQREVKEATGKTQDAEGSKQEISRSR